MPIKEHAPFAVCGITAVTSNAREMSGAGVIGEMWRNFTPVEHGDATIALYTNYESDANGDYTFCLGRRVESGFIAPEEMTLMTVPAARYAVFTTERGPVWETVPKLWQRIWAMSADELGGARSYIADFELYDDSASDPANAVVEIWIGIRE